jgi:putative PIG3 family NAD(P)H quinone oxidoreductase
MRAVVLRAYGDVDVLRFEDIADPPCGPEEVCVAVKATALNRADLLQRRGLYPQPGPAPRDEVPGLEYAGDVIEVGARVTDLARGDRVMGILAGGAYAEKVVTHHRTTIKIPERLSWVEAAAVPEAFITAHDALTRCGLRAGESVLVHAAASGVGLAAVQTAKIMGALPVIGTASSHRKLEEARKCGLDEGIAYAEQDFAVEVARIRGGHGVDVIVDFVGASYLERNIKSLAPCGRLIVIGLLGGISAELNLGLLLNRRLSVFGTVLRPRPLEEKIAATRAFATSIVPHLARGGAWPVVDRVFPFADVADAHAYMETNANVGKIVLEL